MLNVALTGNVASGKSTVVRWFAEWGAKVIDSDALVAEAQKPGSKILAAMVREFGSSILRTDGSLDRNILRRIVLVDSSARAALNAIVHPAVRVRREELTADARRHGERILINDIPLLFEVMDPAAFDLVILVDAPQSVRRARILERGLSEAEAELLMASQLPSNRKRHQAHIVIENRGSLEEFENAARQAWKEICARAEDRS